MTALPLHERVTFDLAGGVTRNYRAAVTPITAAETYELGRNLSSVTYRLILPAFVHEITSTAELIWRGKRYSALGPAMCFTLGGRVHHWEVFIGRKTG